MWSSTRLPDTPMLFRMGKQHIYIELISYFYPCLCCNLSRILRFFPAKSIFYNLDRIMGPGGTPKIITFLSYSFTCNR